MVEVHLPVAADEWLAAVGLLAGRRFVGLDGGFGSFFARQFHLVSLIAWRSLQVSLCHLCVFHYRNLRSEFKCLVSVNRNSDLL